MTVFINNRKAHFNYTILDTYEAGIELLGFEVKSIKKGLGNIDSAFCIVRGGEIFIVNMNIEPYQPNNMLNEYERNRTRKLLLSKKEIKKLSEKDGMKGLTLVPISVYSKGPYIKISVAIGQGKKSYDKRETIKKREADREIRREHKIN